MQRSKAAVSVEVKQVIEALCRLLAAAGLDAVPPPEAFRRAKFGHGPEEDQFWKLLANILQTTGVVSSETSAQIRGGHRKLVTAGLWQTGYHADWMYRKEGGEGGEDGGSFSSRDLLLALGWLLAAGTLDKLLAQRLQQLDKTLISALPAKWEFSSEFQMDETSLRRLQWLIGSLRHQGRTLLSMIHERTRALHAVFSASLSTSTSSSGQSSAALQQDCVCLQQLCDLLEAYVRWKQVEKVFWTWMDSVVDCHLADLHVKRSSQAPGGSPKGCHHGDRGLQKLDEMLMRLPTDQEAQRRRGCADRGESLQDAIAPSLPPPPSSLPTLPSFPPVCRARLQPEKPVAPRCCLTEGPHGEVQAPHELPASQAAERLLHAESVLLQQRDRQRLANRMQLQDLIGRLDELLLIPL
ncbi:tubulin epsilon and delta complex protein 1 [Melanotaenia boesemani]|uniref:tubulin epsilon and delta complex protein 1 n=1 Tax=Melanotaenia boesemani TaxID=1250792 RepID=UPI001C05271C|nr:tubulin epsilon and delta complex protein 1 [Melanotaenia boesemani]